MKEEQSAQEERRRHEKRRIINSVAFGMLFVQKLLVLIFQFPKILVGFTTSQI